MSAADGRRAHYDDIEFDDQLALLSGVPFTGTSFANYVDARPEVELNYVDGLPSGIQKQWYPNGQLETERQAVRGRGSDWLRQWHSNGVMKLERINGGNFPLLIREWAEDGKLIRETRPTEPR